MAEKLRQSLEKLKAAADITHALAVQMAELLKLREAVQEAEQATARRRPGQRRREIISTAYRAQASASGNESRTKYGLATQRDNEALPGSVARTSDVISLEHLHEARIRNGVRKTKVLPGRLFMQSQWR